VIAVGYQIKAFLAGKLLAVHYSDLLTHLDLRYIKQNAAAEIEWDRCVRSAGSSLDRFLSSTDCTDRGRDALKVIMCSIAGAASESGILGLHGVVVSHAGSAAMICANNGTGKTDLSLSLAAHGFKINAGDFAFIDVQTSKMLFGSHAIFVRMRSAKKLARLSETASISSKTDASMSISHCLSREPVNISAVICYRRSYEQLYDDQLSISVLTAKTAGRLWRFANYYQNMQLKGDQAPCWILEEKSQVMRRYSLLQGLVNNGKCYSVFGGMAAIGDYVTAQLRPLQRKAGDWEV